jgi:hypothetical protein
MYEMFYKNTCKKFEVKMKRKISNEQYNQLVKECGERIEFNLNIMRQKQNE